MGSLGYELPYLNPSADMKRLLSIWILFALIATITVAVVKDNLQSDQHKNQSYHRKIRPFFYEDSLWRAPDERLLDNNPDKSMIIYGRDLIKFTAYYLGPSGKVAAISNGMNCQNCHLDAGSVLYANPFCSVSSNYPKFRNRSGKTETIEERINDCMKRSLNGNELNNNSREMKAMIAYIRWLGCEVPARVTPSGTGVEQLALLERSADTIKGRQLFLTKCTRCHGEGGQGKMKIDSAGYVYPPLWGEHSYNTSAGMFRISALAGFIKNNMPFGASSEKPELSNEEAWDIAAFICSQPRPQKFFSEDWPVLSTKPFDHPFPPYADEFSATQHKYGPFKPIIAARQHAKK